MSLPLPGSHSSAGVLQSKYLNLVLQREELFGVTGGWVISTRLQLSLFQGEFHLASLANSLPKHPTELPHASNHPPHEPGRGPAQCSCCGQRACAMGTEITFVKAGGLSPLEVHAAKEASSAHPPFASVPMLQTLRLAAAFADTHCQPLSQSTPPI